ncbi:hypothetical protein Hesp01_74540 [Herbidospora sp. NBRC 101105]|nr:hypothetical protein Hesp01_74540 [Herbidospora sp. NBRC 101105]
MLNDRPSAAAIVASGPVPPPEKASSTAVAMGATLLSARRSSVVSTATQSPSLWIRTGKALTCMVKVPSVLA